MRKLLFGCLVFNAVIQLNGLYRDSQTLTGDKYAAHTTFRILEFAGAAYIVVKFLEGRKDEEL